MITSNGEGVIGASFAPGMVAGAWKTLFGSNLAAALKTWDGLIDAQGNFPTAIDGVRVTIDGLPAFINFISANQINVQAPALTRTGMVPVVVTTPEGTSCLLNTFDAAEDLTGLVSRGRPDTITNSCD